MSSKTHGTKAEKSKLSAVPPTLRKNTPLIQESINSRAV